MKEEKQSHLVNDLVRVMGWENYRGLLIQHQIGGIVWAGQKFTSKEELDEYLDKASKAQKKPI